MSKQEADYGSWPSPITADMLTRANVGLSEPQLRNGLLYWLESRPLERGRSTVRCLNGGEVRELLPQPLNARSKVNEYGGGSYCVGDDGSIYFVLFDDQRVYALDPAQNNPVPQPLTAEGPWRFGNLVLDASRKRLLAVAEDHSNPDAEEETFVAAISLRSDGREPPQKLLRGRDFYGYPSLSPDGRQLAWLCWDHPNMPWDAAECWIGDLDDNGAITGTTRIAGGPGESVCQPRWSPSGELYLISDRSNWWNLYRWRDGALQPLARRSADFGSPQWVFAQSNYAFLDERTILATYTRDGQWYLCRIDTEDARINELETELTDIAYLQADASRAVLLGASGERFPALYALDPQTDTPGLLLESGEQTIDPDYLARAEPIAFPRLASDQRAYGFFYPPANKDFCGPAAGKPPLLVLCHGGPTAATRSSLNLKIQYWTSRGFAVADVNYGGSTGYGREYRQRLNGQWGVVDVEDAVACVNYLAEQGRIDRERTAIRGSSAGGYTVLAALTFHDSFRAGASLYGIGDLETLAADTHKFESRYLDQLVGPYPAQRSLYRERSPIHHIEQLNCPVIFLQGLKDKVVPPSQAEAMVAALDAKQMPVAYVTFEEEAHGFRQAANIRRALEAELYFYSRVFGFEAADDLEALPIRHAAQLEAS